MQGFMHRPWGMLEPTARLASLRHIRQYVALQARAMVDVTEREMTATRATKQDRDSQTMLPGHDMDAAFMPLRKEQEMDAGATLLRRDLETSLAAVRQDMDSGLAALRTDWTPVSPASGKTRTPPSPPAGRTSTRGSTHWMPESMRSARSLRRN